ncbi:hypothetical protein AB0M12_38520 [Nocardia vinacea]|uniref:hypothetical protein n=1 Tax=Nocardia vinacea TaxID=96468 RepID=UPI003432882F
MIDIATTKKAVPATRTHELVAACRAEISTPTDQLISEIFTDNSYSGANFKILKYPAFPFPQRFASIDEAQRF